MSRTSTSGGTSMPSTRLAAPTRSAAPRRRSGRRYGRPRTGRWRLRCGCSTSRAAAVTFCSRSPAARHARAWIVDWLGWDMSPVATDYARTLAGRRGVEGVRFELADALRDPIPAGIDVVLCTLFLHHLTEADAVALLRKMREAARRARGHLGSPSDAIGHRIHLGRVPCALAVRDLPRGRHAIGRGGVHDGRGPESGGGGRADWRAGSSGLAPEVVTHLAQARVNTWDAIVIGAGPAGALSATLLARQGSSVLLVERRAFPRRKVCGGCLNARALASLDRAGLEPRVRALGATTVNALRLHQRGRSAVLELPPGSRCRGTPSTRPSQRRRWRPAATLLTETVAHVVPEDGGPAGRAASGTSCSSAPARAR